MADASERDRSWEEFLEAWDDLRTKAATAGTVIVVEGERDRASLARLHLEGRVVALHRGRSLSRVAHELAETADRVVVLTDWDVEGGHFAQRLREFLRALPVELDTESRRQIARAVRGEVAHVEGLAGWAHRAADRAGITLEAAIAEAELGRRGRRRPTG